MNSLLPYRRVICAALIAALAIANAPVLKAQNAPCYQYDENCKGILKKTGMVAGGLVAVIVLWKIMSGSRKSANEKAAQLRANSAPDTLSINYRREDTMGEANYRMEMIPQSNCPGMLSIEAAELELGPLPPSVKLSTGGAGQIPGIIAGMPDVPGKWSVRVKFTGLTCAPRSGPSRSYESRVANVTINVK